ncbi:MAG: type I 3-dehydroquinate dehydratase [Clostridia bacterium]|nr:type I 3-dehydroquinate dehydratase [Clostridia bacterium]
MSKTVRVRNLVIGEGKTKVIVPIVGKTREEIVEKGASFKNYAIDMVEWRVDFYEDVFDTEKLIETAKQLRAALGEEMPLLYTFRTANEGGEKAIDAAKYTELNKAIAESGAVDLVDVEIFSGDDVVRENIDAIHEAGCLVIGSNHDFHKTPEKDELVRRLTKMSDMGADIPKIAVWPQSRADVLTLFAATVEADDSIDRPLITMSMSPTGVISRLAGEVFGSAMTFGMVGKASAPGQIPVEELQEVLGVLHNSL